jgi:sugar lactone lactonase YvrE
VHLEVEKQVIRSSCANPLRGSDWRRWRVDELQYPETKPAFQSFTVDALGNVWIAENATLEEDNVIEWTVFDPDGTMLGTVKVPKGGGTPNIGDDYLILVWRTELDVQQVRVYRLVKN